MELLYSWWRPYNQEWQDKGKSYHRCVDANFMPRFIAILSVLTTSFQVLCGSTLHWWAICFQFLEKKCNLSKLWSTFKNRMPKSFTLANFEHPISESWLRPCSLAWALHCFQISKAVKQLNCNHRLILTGTPIQNNVLELWSLFDFLLPGFLGTERQFQTRYGKPILQSRDAKSSSKEQEAGENGMEFLFFLSLFLPY